MAATVPKVPVSERRDDAAAFKSKMDVLERFVRQASHMVAFTGAGLSTSGGIPDFRGPDGVWTLRAQGRVGREAPDTATVLPTVAHLGLVELLRRGPLVHIISQNGDGLHRRSGVFAAELSELHGNGSTEVCEACGHCYYRDYRTARKGPVGCRDHYTGRHCELPDCGGRLLEYSIDFEQELPDEPLRAATAHARAADLHVVLGSSLRVAPAADLPALTQQRGGRLVIVNLQPTPLTDRADLHIYADCDAVVFDLLARLGLQLPSWQLVRRLAIGVAATPHNNSERLLWLQAMHPDVQRSAALDPRSIIGGVFRSVAWQTPPDCTHTVVAAVSPPGRHAAVVRSDRHDVDVAQLLASDAAAVRLRFQGHYREPELLLPLSWFVSSSDAASEHGALIDIAFDPHTGRWTVAPSCDVELRRAERARRLAKQLGLRNAARMPSYGRAHARFLQAAHHRETEQATPVDQTPGLTGAIATLLTGAAGFSANPRTHCDHVPARWAELHARLQTERVFERCWPCRDDPSCTAGRAICLGCGEVHCIGASSAVCDGRFVSRHLHGHAKQHAADPDHAVHVGLEDLSFWCHHCSDYLDNYLIRDLRAPYAALHVAKFSEPPPR